MTKIYTAQANHHHVIICCDQIARNSCRIIAGGTHIEVLNVKAMGCK
jgi:hypothetical protein